MSRGKPERSPGGQRRYSQLQVRQVAQVSEMAGEGLNLAGIRRILILEAEVERLNRKIERLQSHDRPRAAATEPGPPSPRRSTGDD